VSAASCVRVPPGRGGSRRACPARTWPGCWGCPQRRCFTGRRARTCRPSVTRWGTAGCWRRWNARQPRRSGPWCRPRLRVARRGRTSGRRRVSRVCLRGWAAPRPASRSPGPPAAPTGHMIPGPRMHVRPVPLASRSSWTEVLRAMMRLLSFRRVFAPAPLPVLLPFPADLLCVFHAPKLPTTDMSGLEWTPDVSIYRQPWRENTGACLQAPAEEGVRMSVNWGACSDPPGESCSDAGCPVHGDGGRCPDCGRSSCTGEGCYWPDEAGLR
jgi:hypothetical protein